MLIRTKLRKDLLSILKPLTAAGFEVIPLSQKILAPADRIAVSTFNASEYGAELPKLGECCTITQRIDIQVILTAVDCVKPCDWDQGVEDALDELEERVWPYLNIFIQHAKQKQHLDIEVIGDDVAASNPEAKKFYLQRSITLSTVYKYSANSPDTISH